MAGKTNTTLYNAKRAKSNCLPAVIRPFCLTSRLHFLSTLPCGPCGLYKGDLKLPSDQKTLRPSKRCLPVYVCLDSLLHSNCVHAESVRLDWTGVKVCHATHTTCRVGVSKNRRGNVGVSKKAFGCSRNPTTELKSTPLTSA